MLRLLARYIVVVILGGSLAGLGAHSGLAQNVRNKLNQLESTATQVPTQTVQPTGTPAPTLTPAPGMTPAVSQNGEDNDNSVEEQHESPVAQKHEHEVENRQSSGENESSVEEQREASGSEVEKTPESSESFQVENQNSVQSSQPVVVFLRLGNNLSTELKNFFLSLESGSGK